MATTRLLVILQEEQVAAIPQPAHLGLCQARAPVLGW
eukprot:CAMPEP_0176121608 /NCGR_PEP_ID=MMETSP0120_2-20121206/61221_1 /TAXON_ID=160619 /ORGANISM="Kryptoperidinium foliaceum, Strain CCMP 1326" /LENGTH=36 /DNA_ID= /DNA_START= /DNA_END= /DNA_ORIENTATION=